MKPGPRHRPLDAVRMDQHVADRERAAELQDARLGGQRAGAGLAHEVDGAAGGHGQRLAADQRQRRHVVGAVGQREDRRAGDGAAGAQVGLAGDHARLEEIRAQLQHLEPAALLREDLVDVGGELGDGELQGHRGPFRRGGYWPDWQATGPIAREHADGRGHPAARRRRRRRDADAEQSGEAERAVGRHARRAAGGVRGAGGRPGGAGGDPARRRPGVLRRARPARDDRRAAGAGRRAGRTSRRCSPSARG